MDAIAPTIGNSKAVTAETVDALIATITGAVKKGDVIAVARVAGAQKSVRACVFAQARELRLHPVASLGPDTRELRAQEKEIEDRECARICGMRNEAGRAGVADGGLTGDGRGHGATS